MEVQEGKAKVRVIGLEALIVAKHRAQRDQDIEDIRDLVRRKYEQIRFDILEQIAESAVEFTAIKTAIDFWKNQ